MNALGCAIFDTQNSQQNDPQRIKECDKEYIKNWIIPMLPFQWHKKITEK